MAATGHISHHNQSGPLRLSLRLVKTVEHLGHAWLYPGPRKSSSECKQTFIWGRGSWRPLEACKTTYRQALKGRTQFQTKRCCKVVTDLRRANKPCAHPFCLGIYMASATVLTCEASNGSHHMIVCPRPSVRVPWYTSPSLSQSSS